MKNAQWENWVNFAVGLWLTLAPWMIPGGIWEGRAVAASWNLWFSGTIVLVSSALALWSLKPWEEWVNLAVGAWLIVSPWILGYAGVGWFAWTSVLSGLIIVVLSLLALPIALKPARESARTSKRT